MFENFPYTNFHELNLDWIIKIAKDFLDQYTHIQEVIADGEQSLTDITNQGLSDLENKKNELENLLNEWYESHSEDIANQLADALEDINNLLSEVLSSITTAKNSAISDFNNRAEQKAIETIASIPDDYSSLANEVQTFSSLLGGNLDVLSNTDFVNNYYYDITGTIHNDTNPWKTTNFIPVGNNKAVLYSTWIYISGNNSIASVAFFDKSKTFISAFETYSYTTGVRYQVGWTTIPENAVYYVATTNINNTPSAEIHLTTNEIPIDLTPFKSGNTTMYNHDGTIYNSQAPFYESDYIPVNGFNIVSFSLTSFHGNGLTLESVTFFNANLERIGGVFPAIKNNTLARFNMKSVIPENAKFVKIFYRSDAGGADDRVSFIKAENPVSIVCIGDSITEGTDGVTNYPTNMIDTLGINYTAFNAGIGGLNAATYWNGEYQTLIDFTQMDVAIIMFGMNGGMTNTFDTDVDPYDNYTDYANTITGCTCKLIEYIMTQNPDILIVIAQPPYAISAQHEEQAENQIENIPGLVERYNLPVIKIHTLTGVNAKNASNYILSDNVHGNAKYTKKIGQAMARNLLSFLNEA